MPARSASVVRRDTGGGSQPETTLDWVVRAGRLPPVEDFGTRPLFLGEGGGGGAISNGIDWNWDWLLLLVGWVGLEEKSAWE